jgi:hypothetical protein
MGFLDSKSKSSTTSQNIGISEVDGPLNLTTIKGIGTGKNSTANVTITDAGATQAALALSRDLSIAALDFGSKTQQRSADLTQATQASSAALANMARQSETSGAINNLSKYGAILAGLAILAWALVKARR